MNNLNKQNFNVTYHPIMDNYKKYDNVRRTPFDPKYKFLLSGSMFEAYTRCPRPCIDVTYGSVVEKSYLTDEEKVSFTACSPGDGIMLIAHRRIIDYELVTQQLSTPNFK